MQRCVEEQMTRYIIENECKHIDQLKDFDFEGFEFHSEDKKGRQNCSSRSANCLTTPPFIYNRCSPLLQGLYNEKTSNT